MKGWQDFGYPNIELHSIGLPTKALVCAFNERYYAAHNLDTFSSSDVPAPDDFSIIAPPDSLTGFTFFYQFDSELSSLCRYYAKHPGVSSGQRDGWWTFDELRDEILNDGFPCLPQSAPHDYLTGWNAEWARSRMRMLDKLRYHPVRMQYTYLQGSGKYNPENIDLPLTAFSSRDRTPTLFSSYVRNYINVAYNNRKEGVAYILTSVSVYEAWVGKDGRDGKKHPSQHIIDNAQLALYAQETNAETVFHTFGSGLVDGDNYFDMDSSGRVIVLETPNPTVNLANYAIGTVYGYSLRCALDLKPMFQFGL